MPERTAELSGSGAGAATALETRGDQTLENGPPQPHSRGQLRPASLLFQIRLEEPGHGLPNRLLPRAFRRWSERSLQLSKRTENLSPRDPGLSL